MGPRYRGWGGFRWPSRNRSIDFLPSSRSVPLASGLLGSGLSILQNHWTSFLFMLALQCSQRAQVLARFLGPGGLQFRLCVPPVLSISCSAILLLKMAQKLQIADALCRYSAFPGLCRWSAGCNNPAVRDELRLSSH